MPDAGFVRNQGSSIQRAPIFIAWGFSVPIIMPVNKITITIDSRQQPAKVDMRVEHQISIPELLIIFHTLMGQMFHQLMMAGMPQPAPVEPAPGPDKAS